MQQTPHVSVPPLHIGPVTIPVPFLLAPMAGYTHLPYREICHRCKAGLTYTELTVAEGIARQMPPTMIYLETSPEDTPAAAHIYGSNPDSMARAASVIHQLGSFCAIDINCGCPVRKVTSKGAGAALMRSPQTVFEIIQAVKSASPLPVTIKTRIGRTPNTANIHEIADAAQQAGADAITVHARYACDRHKGPADWTALRDLKSNLRIPLIANGGANTADDAINMLHQTNADAVMIGRAALGNPWIFREIYARITNGTWTPPTNEEKQKIISEHAQRTVDMMERALQTRRKSRYSAEQAGCRLFRAHLVKYLAGVPRLKHILLQHEQIESLEQIQQITEQLLPAF